MKNIATLAPLAGLTAALGIAATLSAVPSCGGSNDAHQTGGAGGTSSTTTSGGAGGADGGTIFISPDMCKPVGAANEVGPSDPNAQGQCIFLLDAWGTEVLGEWPPASFMLSLMTSEPSVFGNQYASFGFVPDPNDELPIGFKRGLHDPTQIHETCALCHTTKLPDGRLWFGVPNGNLDFGRFQVEVNKRWVAAGNPSLLTPLAEQKSVTLGPGRTDAESGSYPIAVPADFPVYFNLGQRTATNYLGTGKNVRTEAFLSIYTFGAGSPNAATAKVPFPPEARVDAFLAFFGNLQPPVGPAQDPSLVAQGQAAYATARCGSCHHPDNIALDGIVTYDTTSDAGELYPGDDPNFPRGTIRTDIYHRALYDSSILPPMDAGGGGAGGGAGGSDAGGDSGYADIVEFIIAQHLSIQPSDGYRTSDLRGLWATAPYLHNGSVPTLADLLNPASMRPVTFMRGSFLVDTTVLANGNMGHEFGTTLSDSDKQALVAYLMSL